MVGRGVGISVLAVALLGCASGRSASKTSLAHAASSTTVVPALQTRNPQVIAVPSSGLRDGEVIAVKVTGFGVGGKVWLLECATVSAASSAGCGRGLPGQVLLVTDDQGSGTSQFTVSASASSKPDNTRATAPCASACVLVATVGIGIGFGFAWTPLGFADG